MLRSVVMASGMKYDKKTGKYVNSKKAAPQPQPFDEEGYSTWRSGKNDMYDMLSKQLLGISGELDEGAVESLMRQIYERGVNKKALRQIEKNYGVKDISGKGRSDANLTKEIRDTKGVDKKNQPVSQGPAPAAPTPVSSNKPAPVEWDEKNRIGNSNAAIAAVTDQQIANGAWFEHSKAGKTKITKEMRDWAKNYVEKSTPKGQMKPDIAPDTSGAAKPSAPTPAQNNAAASVPKTTGQQAAADAQELARKRTAEKANQAVNVRNMPQHMRDSYVNLGPMANTVRQGMR